VYATLSDTHDVQKIKEDALLAHVRPAPRQSRILHQCVFCLALFVFVLLTANTRAARLGPALLACEADMTFPFLSLPSIPATSNKSDSGASGTNGDSPSGVRNVGAQNDARQAHIRTTAPAVDEHHPLRDAALTHEILNACAWLHEGEHICKGSAPPRPVRSTRNRCPSRSRSSVGKTPTAHAVWCGTRTTRCARRRARAGARCLGCARCRCHRCLRRSGRGCTSTRRGVDILHTRFL
jgi:hypothetical protein